MSTANSARTGNPGIVKSIKQRQLLRTWTLLPKAAGTLPIWSGWKVEDHSAQQQDVIVYRVDRSSVPYRFHIQQHGEAVTRLFRTSDSGKYLEDVLPAALAPTILSTYNLCVESKMPAYSTMTVRDRQNRPVDYERLLLPFVTDAADVAIIFASIEAISEHGAFDAIGLMREQASPPAVKNFIIETGTT